MFDWENGNLKDYDVVCNSLEEVRTNIDRIDEKQATEELRFVYIEKV